MQMEENRDEIIPTAELNNEIITRENWSDMIEPGKNKTICFQPALWVTLALQQAAIKVPRSGT